MSLNEIKKESQIAGKGQNVTYEIAILMKNTSAAKNDIDAHVPENGGTCQFTKIVSVGRRVCQRIAINVKRRPNQLQQVVIFVVNHALAET
jgi:hypothetical protein